MVHVTRSVHYKRHEYNGICHVIVPIAFMPLGTGMTVIGVVNTAVMKATGRSIPLKA
jgi:hypothetical protein